MPTAALPALGREPTSEHRARTMYLTRFPRQLYYIDGCYIERG